MWRTPIKQRTRKFYTDEDMTEQDGQELSMSSAMRSIPEKRRKRITRTAPWFTVLCRVSTAPLDRP
ncbi:MAG: hypothetical protein ACLRHO_09310 [Ruminococcus sp.]